MDRFSEVYASLNEEQRAAVDTLDGPLLVIAGPGTGKTQLLSARVANILEKTDVPARNILCLTFTESGAENMRARLTGFIGQQAYDVTISTYHAFGGDLIKRYPEYFTETHLQKPVDELGRRQIVTGIVENMSYTNPLKQTRHHLEDLMSTMSEVKRALLKPDDLRAIADENISFIRHMDHELVEIFEGFTRMPTFKHAVPRFEQILKVVIEHTPEISNPRFGSLSSIMATTLARALEDARETQKTTCLTAWKNDWLLKDTENHFTLSGALESKRIRALADVMEHYHAALAERNLYDFDDMIIKSVDALEQHNDLRFTLQERYLYVLLDEFQDTNAAQARLVQLLADNPVNEGRPNIMAVGDDDQAIYAFQGAQYSNMLDFYRAYRDVLVINLTKNYRSHADILSTAQHVAEQITERLQHHFDMSKILEAANSALPKQAILTRREFLSNIAQADAIAGEIRSLIDRGVQPDEIAVIAPRHRQLEILVPYLNTLGIPVRYEKRENILETPLVKQLLTMSRLALALRDRNETVADSIWPEVLSYDFWSLPVSSIWQVSWHVADARRRGEHVSWSQALLSSNVSFRIPALLFLSLAGKIDQENCETILDYLIGTIAIDTNEPDLPHVYSPLRKIYMNASVQTERPELFYEALSHLTVLRARLRDHQNTLDRTLMLPDFIAFVDMYVAADERMVNTSPYSQQANAVQLMTVFKAKGLEFQHVFLPDLQDDVWGSTSRGQGNRLTLPANLAPIRHAGATDDERLRIFFVAITRAKIGLHLYNVARTYSGKQTRRLKYLDEREEHTGVVKDYVLPEHNQLVHVEDSTPPAITLLELNWRHHHSNGTHQPDLRALLQERLSNYRLSPTHLSTFLDLEYGGPEHFFFSTILRFPEAPSPDSEFGNAIHETLEWLQQIVTNHSVIPPASETIAYFIERMEQKKLPQARKMLEIERGQSALSAYLTSRGNIYKPSDRAEINFRYDGVHIDDIRLSGKVDRLEIDANTKTITVVDYKTGKSYGKWENIPKLQRYRRQLYSYKLLIERSGAFAGYHVSSGRLEFIEPDIHGNMNHLELIFSEDEVERTRLLTAALWRHVHELDFPDIRSYDASLSGMRQFEQDLIDGAV